MKTLVTGGAGFIPSHLVDTLVSRGDDVIVLDDFSIGDKENLKGVAGSIELIEGSILDKKILSSLQNRVGRVFHCAVLSLEESLEFPEKVHEVNATGTLLLLNTFKKTRFYCISSSEVYGDAVTSPMNEGHPTNPTTPYAVSKLCAEKYASSFKAAYNSPVTIIRPFNAYGPRQRYKKYGALIPKFIYNILTNKPPVIYGNGEQRRDYTYVSDIVQGIVQCDSEKTIGMSINLGSGTTYSITDVLRTITKVTGKNIQPVFSGERRGDLRLLQADISKARNVIGYRPTMPFEEGIKRTVHWLQEKEGIT